jgi:lysophospholipase L1-like esterase
MQHLLKASLLLGIVWLGMAFPLTVSQRIFTIGDSTVQDYADGWAPRKGWGQMLQAFFDTAEVEVLNRAVGGTSSKSFYNSFWPGVKSELQAGDVVFIQFGINDRNQTDTARTAYGDVYKGYLRAYVNEARALGAVPVLVSTVRRNAWNADGTAYDAYHEHPELTREVAAELNVLLIDLDAKNQAGMEAAGEAYVTRYWYNNYPSGEYPNYPNGANDNVHFQEMGAIQLAKYVVEGIQELSNDPDLGQLIPFIKPQHEVKVIANHPHAGLITRTERYPEGLNLHIKALPYSGHTFLQWQDSAGVYGTTDSLFQFTMDTTAHSFVAYFDDLTPPTLDCAGVLGGYALVDECGTCAGGTTNLVPCTDPVQGEAACLVTGLVADTTYAGFAGTGYANLVDTIGSRAVWGVYAPSADSTTMYVRYANGGIPSQPMALWVNGVEVAELTFTATGGFTTWSLDSATVDLLAGNNAVQLRVKTAEGAPMIDWVDFAGAGVMGGSCAADCQGVLAGNASVDSCGICVGGTTGLEPCTQDCAGLWGGSSFQDSCGYCITSASESCLGAVQGEDACEVDGILLETVNAGFIGAGYANTDNAIGTRIVLWLSATQATETSLDIRYANGGAAPRDGSLFIDGVEVDTVNFAPTGAWTSWGYAAVSVTLTEGPHQIRLEAVTNSGLPNIDLLGWFDPSLSKSECLTLTARAAEKPFASVYPNPFTQTFRVESPQVFSFQLLNTTGQVLQQGQADRTLNLGSELPAGLYLLHLTSNQGKQTLRLLKR